MSKTNVFKRVFDDSNDLTKAVVRRIIDGDFNKLNDDIVEDVVNEISSKNLQNNINLSNYLAIPDNQKRIQNEIKEFEGGNLW